MSGVRAPFLFAALSIALVGAAWGGAGKDGFEVLRLEGSPRQAAMAEAGQAFGSDADGLTLNPGTLGLIRAPEASLSHASLPLSLSVGSVGYAQPLGRGAWGGRFTLLRLGGLAGYDDAGTRLGDVKVRDEVATLGYGRRLARGGGIGLSFKQARQTIGRDTASLWAMDAGWVRPLGDWPLLLTVAARNLGGQATFVSAKTAPPRSYNAGLCYRGFQGALTAGTEARRGSDGRTTAALGLEVWGYNTLALRAGYDTAQDLGGGLALGLGIRLNGIRLDYAFLLRGEGFDPTHRVGMRFRWGRPGERAYQDGVGLAQKGRHAEAIYKFKEVLDEDPSFPGAVRALRESVDALERDAGGSK